MFNTSYSYRSSRDPYFMPQPLYYGHFYYNKFQLDLRKNERLLARYKSKASSSPGIRHCYWQGSDDQVTAV